MIIGLIGDLEGDRDWAVSRLRALGERGDVEVACQLGDLRFGMGPHPQEYLDAIESVCAEFGLQLLCINGNHENWSRLDQLWADPHWQDVDGSLKPIEVSQHVALLPRGHRWDLGGRSFVALGGAPSINRHLLTEGIDWWPSEVIREEHVESTIAGGHAEIMLTHDSPARPYCTEPVAEGLTSSTASPPRPGSSPAVVAAFRATAPELEYGGLRLARRPSSPPTRDVKTPADRNPDARTASATAMSPAANPRPAVGDTAVHSVRRRRWRRGCRGSARRPAGRRRSRGSLGASVATAACSAVSTQPMPIPASDEHREQRRRSRRSRRSRCRRARKRGHRRRARAACRGGRRAARRGRW